MRLFLVSMICFILWTGSALAQPFAYIANEFSDNVSVINTATNTVVTTITVGIDAFGVTVSPDGGFVYVTNGGADTLSVIDTSTNTVTATVTVGTGPGGVAITPDGSFAYVVIQGDGQSNGTVTVIDTSTNTVAATVFVGAPVGAPYGLALSPGWKSCLCGEWPRLRLCN